MFLATVIFWMAASPSRRMCSPLGPLPGLFDFTGISGGQLLSSMAPVADAPGSPLAMAQMRLSRLAAFTSRISSSRSGHPKNDCRQEHEGHAVRFGERI